MQQVCHSSQLRYVVHCTICGLHRHQAGQCRGNTNMRNFTNAIFSAVAAMSISGVLFTTVLI